MPSDLEGSLVEGGIAPAAAKVISNAIANLASAQFSKGRRYGDSTPVEQLRMVTPDARRYVLTNLDYGTIGQESGDFAYKPRDTAHPYEGSQPATSQGTISTPSVVEGDYVSVRSGTKDSVTQATVSLRIGEVTGPHPRLNRAAKSIDGVPFLVEIDQEQFVQAAFEERPSGTVLKITLRNLKQFTINGVTFWGFA